MYHLFYPIEPDLLDADDGRYLIRALESEFAGPKLKEVLRLAEEGLAQIWRFQITDGRGIVVTQILENRYGDKELFIWLLAGHRILNHLRHVDERLAAFARLHGCTGVRAEAVPELARVYQKRHGYKPCSISLLKPVAPRQPALSIGKPPSFTEDEVPLPLGREARGKRFRVWVPTRMGGTLKIRVADAAALALSVDGAAPDEVAVNRRAAGLDVVLPAGRGPAWVTLRTATPIRCAAEFRQIGQAWNRTPDDPLIPWNFWYWPFSAATPWPDRAVRVLRHLLPEEQSAAAVGWERRHHRSTTAQSWEGHCHMGAAASILFEAPPQRYRELEQADLQLLAAEFAGNHARIEQEWRLQRGHKPLKGLRFHPPGYFKPGAPDVSEAAVRHALADEVESDAVAEVARLLIEANGGRAAFTDRLQRWFGELAAEYYSMLMEWLLRDGQPLLADLRAYEPDAGPGEVHNQAIYHFEAVYTENPESTARRCESDRFRMRIECRVFSNDSDGTEGEPVLYTNVWTLGFGPDGRVQIEHPSNRWLSLDNDSGQPLYAPANLVILAPPGRERLPGKEGAYGNPAVSWELLERLPALRLRARYAPSGARGRPP